MKIGDKVAYHYNQHHLLGGKLVEGEGVIIGETVIGTENGYIIQPDSGDGMFWPAVHVRARGVSAI